MFLDFHSEIFSWIRGGLFILFIYHFLIYFQNRSKLYLFYSLYLAALTVYLSQDIFPDNWVTLHHYLNFPIQFLAYAAYVAFARILLDTRNVLVKWDGFFELSIKVLLALVPVFIIVQLFLGFKFQENLFAIIAIAFTVFALVAFFAIYTNIKDKFAFYFVVGSLIYLVLAQVSFAEIYLGKEIFSNYGFQPMFFVYLGAITQSIIFSVVIGFIIKIMEQKSKNAEVRLANKLKEIEELKMTALQSQMNPHFLFNSLNSINNFVLKNEVEKASDYITKFSKLIRAILNSSSSPTSTLSDELDILALYVKLEQMRVTGGFNYIVNIDKKLNLESIKVPPLFLQPFIENAIWHGIMKKEGDKIIALTVKESKGNVLCVVKDNGVGINSAKQKTKMDKKRKFYGAIATENRIKILYKNENVKITTSDISDGKTTGTEVSISFPLINL